MTTRRGVPGGALAAVGAAVIGIAAAGGVRVVGSRLRRQADPRLDDPLEPPSDLVHHTIPSFDGGTVHVVDTGDVPPGGATVVLLHGVTLQWWVWSAVIRLLRQRHRVVAWDMRGHGSSVSGSAGTTLEATADDLERVIGHLGLEGVVIVGHSMGGMTTGRFLAEREAFAHRHVRGVVFLATSAAPTSQGAIIGGLAALSGAAGRAASLAVRRPRFSYPWPAGDLSAVLLSLAFGNRPTARMLADLRAMEAEMSPASMADAAASITTHDVRGDLAHIDLPTQVVVGSRDKLTPPVHSRELVAVIDGAELTVLDGIGHQVMQEAPHAVVDAVEAVLARRGGKARA